jgi:hypothetical protein
MTSFWLFLSSVFKWTFGLFEVGGNVINWILFFASVSLFCYWCYVLYSILGGNKDKEYHSPTEGHYPYYDPKIYKKDL